MKMSMILATIVLLGLSGCATNAGISGSLPIGDSTFVSSNVNLSSAGNIYTNASLSSMR